MNELKKLYRLGKEDGAILCGVCGGIAEYFNLDSNLVRLITAALCLAGGLSIWVYVIAAIILPKKSDTYSGF